LEAQVTVIATGFDQEGHSHSGPDSQPESVAAFAAAAGQAISDPLETPEAMQEKGQPNLDIPTFLRQKRGPPFPVGE